MISKELFVNTMERLETLNRKIDMVDAALKELSPDFGGMYIPEVLDIIIDIFVEIFNDEGKWLSYLVYEKDWLKSFKVGDIVADGENVIIENWENVYDFLIRNMEENNGFDF